MLPCGAIYSINIILNENIILSQVQPNLEFNFQQSLMNYQEQRLMRMIEFNNLIF